MCGGAPDRRAASPADGCGGFRCWARPVSLACTGGQRTRPGCCATWGYRLCRAISGGLSRWPRAGRQADRACRAVGERLAGIRARLGTAAASWPLPEADLTDAASVAALAGAARVVTTTAGPYRSASRWTATVCPTAPASSHLRPRWGTALAGRIKAAGTSLPHGGPVTWRKRARTNDPAARRGRKHGRRA